MRKVIVSFETAIQSFPGVFVPGQFRVSFEGFSQDVDASPATFPEVPAGSYVARVVRLNADGSELGDAATASFEVTDDVTLVGIPVLVNVAVEPV